MKNNNRYLSKRTLALFAVAALLFVSGGFMGVRAALNITSENLDTHFELDHVGVQLLEGHDGTYSRVGRQNDTGGELMAYTEGTIVPGKVYDEHIAALNETGTEEVSAVDQYLRIVVHKYWIDKNGNHDNTLDPSLIKLTYGNSPYNQSAWQKNDSESTTETETYYYKSALAGQEQTPDLFNRLSLDASVAGKDHMTKTESDWVNGKKTITYNYEYNGRQVCVEAEVQALQPHNINKAIKSVWGVQNVSVSGGTLVVK